jgi:hypothetical protein
MEREIQVHQVQSLKIFLLCIAEEDSGAKDETQSLAEGERGRSVGRVWSAVVTGGPAERPEFAVREDEVRKEILLRGGRSRLAVAPDVGVVFAWEPDLESPGGFGHPRHGGHAGGALGAAAVKVHPEREPEEGRIKDG